MNRKLPLAIGILALALGAWPFAASAHTHLEKSQPEKDAVLTQAPHEVKLVFSGRIETDYSKIVVTDAAGKRVNQDKMTGSTDEHELATELSDDLKPGAYNVKWNVISGDGHRVKGEFGFTLK
jgi:methionine-rich copper-binding protein CopC